jgi:hypothetical protein
MDRLGPTFVEEVGDQRVELAFELAPVAKTPLSNRRDKESRKPKDRNDQKKKVPPHFSTLTLQRTKGCG